MLYALGCVLALAIILSIRMGERLRNGLLCLSCLAASSQCGGLALTRLAAYFIGSGDLPVRSFSTAGTIESPKVFANNSNGGSSNDAGPIIPLTQVS